MAKNKKASALGQKRYAFSLSIKEAVGWLTLLLFISGWFFVLGIVVGRWYVPVPGPDHELQEELLAAREEAPARPDRPVPEALPFQYDDDNDIPMKASRPEPVATKRPAVVKEISGEASPVVSSDQTDRPPSGDTPEPDPETAAEAPFTIQIAALKEQKTADQLMQKLRKSDFPAYVTRARLADGSVWYRVRCGRFSDRQTADPVMTALRKDGYSPLLVKR